ncbi:hypothetical protein GCM10011351_00500 [Paraliobacillus quinghaiensis]|uniref:NodB homology domain-containing protein n=1 Tax=Paraliobacillus quinghaiensis TaxID=470815 RepID=A0A917WNG2_9BACI|nr:polysaccharide deacetylase family protein [Paraliobacillus quinghaiensis]GGM18601.1 hypothetical protein GCM10011351_00500 [Paraliobacillus quinghaiensis]
MNEKSYRWLLFIAMFLFVGTLSGTQLQAQLGSEDLPEPKGGSELEERVRYPVSNTILQQQYPDTLVLSGNETEKKVALTFDDGPDPRFTPQILDVLKENDIKATFFVMGARAEAYPDIVKRIIDEGHIIGNHTYWHPNLVEQADVTTLVNELKKTEDTLANLIDYQTKLFRAPYGFLYNELVEKLKDLSYSVVGWSVDSLDWQEQAPEIITYNVLNNIHPGAIILMHDGAAWEGDRTNTIKSLRQIIPAIKEQGMEFVTVPELVDISYK